MDKEQMSRAVLRAFQTGAISKEDCFAILKEFNAKEMRKDIAIVGMSCYYPEAETTQQYWDNLLVGKDSIRGLSKGRKKLAGFQEEEEFTIQCGFLENIEMFDAQFFDMNGEDAIILNPNQRIILEKVWEAFEDSGYTKTMLDGSETGVFLGMDTYHQIEYGKSKDGTEQEEIKLQQMVGANFLSAMGSMASIMATRVNYTFNLCGPSMTVDSLCSSGLSTVHLACQALISGECTLAVAGGIHLNDFSKRDDEMMSEDGGVCAAFDQSANGIVWSEGCGIVILKPLEQALEDRNHIYAVVKGSAINNDGASSSFTAMNTKTETKVITRAWERARINPEMLSYIEAHGTGTIIGDCIELKGIKEAFEQYTDKKQFCAIGSVKPSIGHAVAASGLASLQKTVLSMVHKQFVPTIHFEEPNHLFEFEDSPCYVSDSRKDWDCEHGPRYAGVSSFSFSRSNCHVVLEEAPEQEKEKSGRTSYIYTISAKNLESLLGNVNRQLEYMTIHKDVILRDVCYTMAVGKDHHEKRIAFVVHSVEDVIHQLGEYQKSLSKDRKNSIGGEALQSTPIDAKKQRELKQEIHGLLTSLEKQPEEQTILDKLCKLYMEGANVDWTTYFIGEECYLLSLPTYSFCKKAYWIKNLQTSCKSSLQDAMRHRKTELQGKEVLHQNHTTLKEDEVITEVVLIGGEEETHSETAVQIAHLYAGVLKISQIDMSKTFAQLGGDSMKAIALVSEFKKCGLGVSVDQILECASIEQLSKEVKQLTTIESQEVVTGEIELVPVQSCFYEYNFANMHHWNNSLGIFSKERLDETIIEQALYEVVKHHDALRMVYRRTEDNIIQYNQGITGTLFDFYVYDFRDTEDEMEKIEGKERFLQSSISLEDGPLMKLAIFRKEEGDHLMIVIHHLISDFLSIVIILQDLMTAYHQMLEGQKVELPLKSTSFKKWSQELHAYAMKEEIKKEFEYWKAIDQAPVQKLPKDYPVNNKAYKYTTILSEHMTKEETKQLIEYGNKVYGASTQDLLLTALGLAIEEWSGNQRTLIGLCRNGRDWTLDNVDISRTVGWFSISYPMLLDYSECVSLNDKLSYVMHTIRSVPNKGAGYDILRHITLPKSKSDVRLTAQPEIFFNYHGEVEKTENEEDSVRVSSIGVKYARSEESDIVYNFDVAPELYEEKIVLNIGFSLKEYKKSTVQSLLHRYAQKLRELISHMSDQLEKPKSSCGMEERAE